MDTSDHTTSSKLCRKCGKEYPATTEYFRPNRHGNIGSPCRQCEADAKRAWRKANPDKAKQHKSESQKRNRDGANRRYQRWLMLHPDENKRRYRNNPEPAKVRARRRRIEKKVELQVWYKVYNRRPDVMERHRISQRGKYRPNHHLAVIRYRSRKRNLPDTFSAEEWEFALQYFGHSCAYCGSSERLTVDHFVPLTSPECPGTVAENMIPACLSCNSSKRDNDPISWLIARFGDYRAHEILSVIGAYSEYV